MEATRKSPNSSDERRHQDEEQETQNRRPDTNNTENTSNNVQQTRIQTTNTSPLNPSNDHTETENTEDCPEPYFGDVAGPTDEEHFRVGAWNVDNLPVCASESKNGNIFKAIQHMSLDAPLMQEVGINWSLTPRQDGWLKRTEDTFERNSAIALSLIHI